MRFSHNFFVIYETKVIHSLASKSANFVFFAQIHLTETRYTSSHIKSKSVTEFEFLKLFIY